MAIILPACTAENRIGRDFFPFCETEQPILNTEDVPTIDSHSSCNSVKKVGVVKEASSHVLPEYSIPQSISAGQLCALNSYGECGSSFSNPCKDFLPLKSASLRVCSSTADQKAPMILAPHFVECSSHVHQELPFRKDGVNVDANLVIPISHAFW